MIPSSRDISPNRDFFSLSWNSKKANFMDPIVEQWEEMLTSFQNEAI